MGEWMLETDQLCFTYMAGTPYQTQALREVTCRVARGEIVALMGPTGCGKTTLVQHFNGILQAASGQVRVGGRALEKPGDLKWARDEVGLLFQFPEYQLFEETVFADVAFGPRNQGVGKEELPGRVCQAMELVGLSYQELKDRSPFSLSGGQMRRAALAGVLARKPQVLILDEPTAGLDPRGRDEILGLVESLNREQGLTILMISHSVDEAAALAGRILVMEGGALVGEGTPAEVFSRREWVESLGLELPEYSRLMGKLAQAGYPVSTQVFTCSGAREEILKLWSS